MLCLCGWWLLSLHRIGHWSAGVLSMWSPIIGWLLVWFITPMVG